MIFPKPISEKYFEGTSNVKKFNAENSLFDFYKNADSFDIDFAVNNSFVGEEYELKIEKDKVFIAYLTEEGKFRAITSLRHIVLNCGENLPLCEVHDKPDFERRSYMLDISRYRMPNMKTILDFVDLLVDLKYNEFQLYMDSFCFKYTQFPEYVKDVKCLTVEDIEYLDNYCAERFIDLVPNQNSFGHMHHWVNKPELKHLALSEGDTVYGTLNPLLDESVELMDKIYGSLFPYFKSKYAHIGLDEAFGLGRFQTKEACERDGIDTVFVNYLNKLNTVVNEKYGKEIQFWDDMIISHPESFDKFPKNVTAVEWGYGIISTQMMEQRCRVLQEKGVRYYVAPGTAAWEALTSRVGVMEFNVRTAAELGRKYGAVGFMMTDWGMPADGHMQFLVHSYFPCAMAAQYGWNVGREQDRQSFKNAFRFGAMEYLDKNVFHGEKVGELMYKLGRYYYLEPHKIHGMTMCASALFYPLTQRFFGNPDLDDAVIYDMDKLDDPFYFENVIEYVTKVRNAFIATEFDERLKREILVNAEMILIGAEISLIKTNKAVSEEKRAELISRINEVIKEYTDLWMFRNYPDGIEQSVGCLEKRRDEIAVY